VVAVILFWACAAVTAAIAAGYGGYWAGHGRGTRQAEADIGRHADEAWQAAADAVNLLEQARRDMRVGFIAVPSWDGDPIRGAAITSAEAEEYIAMLRQRADLVIDAITAPDTAP
jgi:hypothetical protein